MKSALFTALLFSALSTVRGKPLVPRQSITTLTTSQINAYTPYTYFASAGYCTPSATLAWNCGAICTANSDFIPYASGGDGSSTQYWFVGYSPSLATVIVSHQGTIPSSFEADLTDIDIYMGTLSSTLFPGLSSSIEVHDGFRDEHALTATTILAAVQAVISAHSAKKVTTVGHSLGAALALLDGIYLPLHISGVSFQTIGYGLPRVGNQAFADYVDAHLSLTHINNREDPIPICPGMSLGFVHPSGEIHIQDSGAWVSCPGQDNASTSCIVGDVPYVTSGSISDHDGPYNGISMGSPGC